MYGRNSSSGDVGFLGGSGSWGDGYGGVRGIAGEASRSGDAGRLAGDIQGTEARRRRWPEANRVVVEQDATVDEDCLCVHPEVRDDPAAAGYGLP